jgi:hypothetical protein
VNLDLASVNGARQAREEEPDVSARLEDRLLVDPPAHRVEMLMLPVDQITESAARVEPTPTPARGSRENVDPTARPAAAE